MLHISFQTQNFQTQKHGSQKGGWVNIVGALATLSPARKSGSAPCNGQAVGNESVAQQRRKVLAMPDENSELFRTN